MHITLFKGQSQYGSLRLHIDQLAAALAEQGHVTRVVDLMAGDQLALLQGCLDAPSEVYLGFAGVGADWTVGGASAYDRLGASYVSLYVDHPLHMQARLAAPARKKVSFFLDRSHVQFMTASGQARGHAHLGFLPPGGNELGDPPDLSDEAFARRDIPVLFTGTYRGAPELPWRDWADTPARSICELVAQRMAADARLPVMEAFKAALLDLGATLTPDLFTECLPLLKPPQAFAEAYHRERLLNVLGEAGVPLHVWGHGWEPLVDRQPSFTYGGVGSFEETLHLLRRARVVLNINNGFVAGGHERVFTAMCAGAAVFSDESKYYADAFKAGREIALFAWPQMDKAPGQLMALLGDEARLAAIARAGAKKAQAEHRWADRARKLVKALKQAA
ncbi:glycosyltransferase [Phenylobacterium sp.]|uniref:glycosyltransferase n=1 Tax=Phenylobacterium sp. TaxID=1871053 RepID=UPI002F958FEC